MNIIKNKILLISIIYIFTGPFFYELLNKQFFQFLFDNGFENILKFIFVGNNDKLNFHIAAADKNFYSIYFGTGFSLVSLFFIYNFRNILFKKKYLINSTSFNFNKIKKKRFIIKNYFSDSVKLVFRT